jgi:hypothetical protein
VLVCARWPGGPASTSVDRATLYLAGGSAGVVVERDPQVNLDLPAGDVHVVDDEAQQLLALGEVELVDAGGRLSGEVADALLETVIDGELLAVRDELVALLEQGVVPLVDVVGSSLHLGEVEEAGLVEVGEAASLGAVGVELAGQVVQFGGEELVVGGRCRGAYGGLSGAQHGGPEQGGLDLLEDERVQRVGADGALRAQPLAGDSAASLVAAGVVAVDLAGGSAELVGVEVDVAAAAADQAAQQPSLLV